MKSCHVMVVILCAFISSAYSMAEDTSSTSGEILTSCPLPTKPGIPNGRTSSEAEMIAAQREMQAYMDDSNQVLECLKQLEAGWGEETSDEQRAIVVLFHNKVVEEMESIADLFNSAVRAFKGKN